MINKNDKVSINIEINAEGQQQINQYKKAFDGLRNSINNLSNPLSKLNDGVSDLIKSNKELASQNNSIGDSIFKLGGNYESLKNLIEVLKIAFNEAKIGALSFQTALTGGLSLVLTFLPEIIELTKSFFKGKEATGEWAQNFKNLSGVMKAANTDAAEQTTKLNLLYRAATGVNTAGQERLKYAQQLKDTYPEQFKNFDREQIANGKAKGAYNDLAKSILASAKAKAALNKMTDETAKLLEADYQIEKIQNANYNEKKRRTEELTHGILGGYRGASAKQILERDKKDSDDRAKNAIDLINTEKKKIQARLDYLMKFAKDADEFKTKVYINDLGTAGKDVAVNNNILAESRFSKRYKKDTPESSPFPQFDAELRKRAAMKLMQQAGEDFHKQLTTDTKNYDTELAALKLQQNQKLISQEEYFESWEKLQGKHHANIGETLKLFNERDLARAQKHHRDLVEAEQLKSDKQDLEKAIWPAQKLAAEKKLIEDKYNFEIQKAAEAGKDTAEIRERYQAEITEAIKKHEQERKEFHLQTAQQVSDAAFSILKNNSKAQSDAKLKQLETQKNAELSNTSLTGSQKKAIEEKYHKKEAEEKTKAFKAEQRASILQAVINGALAVTKATAQTGVISPFFIPGIIASTAIQVATIAAQKTPQYAKGGLHYRSDGKGALLPGYSRTDNTNAYLRSGEAVVVSEAMRNPWARNLVSAINVAHGGRDFSISNPGRGYAIGGIFTDGGNSNRYYNQPMNDQKDLANTIAYQMINNFPPVYVDVKDINSQQSILAQTVNRVNL